MCQGVCVCIHDIHDMTSTFACTRIYAHTQVCVRVLCVCIHDMTSTSACARTHVRAHTLLIIGRHLYTHIHTCTHSHTHSNAGEEGGDEDEDAVSTLYVKNLAFATSDAGLKKHFDKVCVCVRECAKVGRAFDVSPLIRPTGTYQTLIVHTSRELSGRHPAQCSCGHMPTSTHTRTRHSNCYRAHRS